MPSHEVLQRIAAQVIAPHRGEERLILFATAFLDPGFHQLRGFAPEGCSPFLAALALALDVRPDAQHRVTPAQADQLRCPQAGLQRYRSGP